MPSGGSPSTPLADLKQRHDALVAAQGRDFLDDQIEDVRGDPGGPGTSVAETAATLSAADGLELSTVG
jgi:hypothetical protein